MLSAQFTFEFMNALGKRFSEKRLMNPEIEMTSAQKTQNPC
jgi:hypothetical protein